MRHAKKFNHLSRTSSHRKAMLSNMAASLIMHKKINTTLAKAKALKQYVEPLITKAKNDTTHSRRVVFRYLQDKEAVAELFREVAMKVADRPGGYTRVLKTGTRLGDNAEMALIELVDYNELMLEAKDEEKAAKSKKRSRRRGGGKGKMTAEVAGNDTAKTEEKDAAKEEVKAEEPKEDEESKKTESKKEEEKTEAKDDKDEKNESL